MLKRMMMSAAGLVAAAVITACGSSTQVYTETHFPSGKEYNEISKGESKSFKAKHTITVHVPEGAKKLHVWLAVPSTNDRWQSVSDLKLEGDHAYKVVTDSRGNNALHVELDGAKAGPLPLVTTWRVTRHEAKASLDASKTRPHTPDELKNLDVYLQDEIYAKVDDDIRAFAKKAVGGETNPITASKKLYDAVLEHVHYWVKDPAATGSTTWKATGTGDARKTFDTCTGNCTDFHSLYAAASRAVGIPTRAVYGSFFKPTRAGLDGKDDQSYHCWIEFHAPGIGWVPLDVAVADVYTDEWKPTEFSKARAILTTADGTWEPDAARVQYYFGNLEARRVSWHWGRDLVLTPKQAGAPLPWFFGGYAEADGTTVKVDRLLAFEEVK